MLTPPLPVVLAHFPGNSLSVMSWAFSGKSLLFALGVKACCPCNCLRWHWFTLHVRLPHEASITTAMVGWLVCFASF